MKLHCALLNCLLARYPLGQPSCASSPAKARQREHELDCGSGGAARKECQSLRPQLESGYTTRRRREWARRTVLVVRGAQLLGELGHLLAEALHDEVLLVRPTRRRR